MTKPPRSSSSAADKLRQTTLSTWLLGPPRNAPSTPRRSTSRSRRPAPRTPIYLTPSWCRTPKAYKLSKTPAADWPREVSIARSVLDRTPDVLATTPATLQSTMYVEPSTTSAVMRYDAPPRDPRTAIKVVDGDTYDTALALLQDEGPGATVCVLNMANEHTQGGGWLEGRTAQEEQLAYRSTLMSTLQLSYYPFPQISAIFSPRVAVFKTASPEFKDYAAMTPKRRPEIVQVVSAAAVDLGSREGKLVSEVEYGVLMSAKMRIVLRTCCKEGVQRLVLGAFGCGAFRGDPEVVAGIWRDLLKEREFAGRWEECVFAVLAKGDEGKANLEVFRKVLEGVVV